MLNVIENKEHKDPITPERKVFQVFDINNQLKGIYTYYVKYDNELKAFYCKIDAVTDDWLKEEQNYIYDGKLLLEKYRESDNVKSIEANGFNSKEEAETFLQENLLILKQWYKDKFKEDIELS